MTRDITSLSQISEAAAVVGSMTDLQLAVVGLAYGFPPTAARAHWLAAAHRDPRATLAALVPSNNHREAA